MNSQALNNAWRDIYEKVRSYDGVDVSQVNAFLPLLQLQAKSDSFIMLTANNDFIKSWIERHYLELIKRALKDLYGNDYMVQIEIAEGTQPQTIVEERDTAPAAIEKKEKIADVKKEEKVKKERENTPAPVKQLTFENFVIGDSNRMAYSMAVAVAERPGTTALNPLFIYGKSGLGKTHLLRAIQNYIEETLPHMKTTYVDAQQLVNDFTDASLAHDKEKESFKNFKNRYEEADVLLIDDVQFFQGKKQTLDIFFQIFNRLTSLGKQVVLSADRAPKNIDVDERYQSRFASGGTCDIQPPEVETKLGIVRSFIRECREYPGNEEIVVPNDVQMYIAENSSSNIRELKSAVTSVITQINVTNNPNISVDEVSVLLQNHFTNLNSKRVTVGDIQREVENFYKVSHGDMLSKKRSRNVTYARYIAIYLCRQLLDIPFNEIGKKFNRDHSTVMYSVNNIEMKLRDSREMREELEAIKKVLLDL